MKFQGNRGGGGVIYAFVCVYLYSQQRKDMQKYYNQTFPKTHLHLQLHCVYYIQSMRSVRTANERLYKVKSFTTTTTTTFQLLKQIPDFF